MTKPVQMHPRMPARKADRAAVQSDARVRRGVATERREGEVDNGAESRTEATERDRAS